MKNILRITISENRIFGLDILRFIAIVFVLISHGKTLLEPVFGNLKFMRIRGFFGVELFFVLSGFLIGGILLRI